MTTVYRRLDLAIDYYFNVPLGLVTGRSHDTKFGANDDVDTGSAPEDVWSQGGTYTGFPDGGADTVDVFSSSTDDSAAGIGARTIRLSGLDANWQPQTVDVTLNGTTAVTTSETWRRLFRMMVMTAGSLEGHAGVITARHTATPANVFGTLETGDNQSLICALTVPAGRRMLIRRIGFFMGRNSASGAADVSIRAREQGGVFRKRRQYTISVGSGVSVDTSLLLPELTDVKATVEDVTANNTSVAAELEYFLIQ